MGDSYEVMGLYMKGIDFAIQLTEEVGQCIMMVKYMKGLEFKGKPMDMASTYIQMALDMKENGKQINNMDMGLKFGLMVLFIYFYIICWC